jgi:SAM-dependent methyltransferase
MDEIARYSVARWKALAERNALFTRPYLQLDAASARLRIDPDGRLGDLAGRQVLLLAGGGGQQSAAFSLLGAQVTVADLSDGQLDRDREVASHYGVRIETVQADMRDLSSLPESGFDIVWQPYSINFVPDARVVFGQVARVIRDGGMYHVQCANPFAGGLTERDWTGEGYLLERPYLDGEVFTYEDQDWVYDRSGEPGNPVLPPREYRHTLSTFVNGLIGQGFTIEHLSDRWSQHPDPSAIPGTWNHFVAFAPPWLAFWTRWNR